MKIRFRRDLAEKKWGHTDAFLFDIDGHGLGTMFRSSNPAAGIIVYVYGHPYEQVRTFEEGRALVIANVHREGVLERLVERGRCYGDD